MKFCYLKYIGVYTMQFLLVIDHEKEAFSAEKPTSREQQAVPKDSNSDAPRR